MWHPAVVAGAEAEADSVAQSAAVDAVVGSHQRREEVAVAAAFGGRSSASVAGRQRMRTAESGSRCRCREERYIVKLSFLSPPPPNATDQTYP